MVPYKDVLTNKNDYKNVAIVTVALPYFPYVQLKPILGSLRFQVLLILLSEIPSQRNERFPTLLCPLHEGFCVNEVGKMTTSYWLRLESEEKTFELF